MSGFARNSCFFKYSVLTEILMRYVILLLLLPLCANGTPAQNTPSAAIGLPEGNPSAVNCPSGQYLAGFNIWSKPQMSGFSPYCVAMQSDGRWQGSPQIHLDLSLGDALTGSQRLDMFCPRDNYASGLAGLSQVYGIHGIVQLTLYCHNVKAGTSTGLATQATPGISTTDWPPAQCADTLVAIGAYASVHDAEFIQLGLNCAPTKPGIAQARFQSAAKSNSLIVAQPHLLAPGAVAAQSAGSLNWSQSARHPSALSRGALGNGAMPSSSMPGSSASMAPSSALRNPIAAAPANQPPVPIAVETVTAVSAQSTRPNRLNRPYAEPALRTNPAPGVPVQTAASSKLDQAGIIIVGGKSAAINATAVRVQPPALKPANAAPAQ